MNWRIWPLRKKFFHTLGHSSPLSPFRPFGHLAPLIWPPLPGHIFICISDDAVQSYFSSPISIEFMKYYGWKINKSKCTERWSNGRKGDRGLQWPSVWKNYFWSGQNLQFTYDLFQFYKAFATKNFVFWEDDSQSGNPCFLGVRSPNQLPKASW